MPSPAAGAGLVRGLGRADPAGTVDTSVSRDRAGHALGASLHPVPVRHFLGTLACSPLGTPRADSAGRGV